jgi:hypothetical protein
MGEARAAGALLIILGKRILAILAKVHVPFDRKSHCQELTQEYVREIEKNTHKAICIAALLL